MTALRRPGAKFVTRIPYGEKVVSMITYKGKVLVATERRIMKLVGNQLRPFLIAR